uniref:Uncharacterized protein n=1 Tax=Romanomermis culicivorax TaxID=13658 RepID=A0A915L3S4_ROMCU
MKNGFVEDNSVVPIVDERPEDEYLYSPTVLLVAYMTYLTIGSVLLSSWESWSMADSLYFSFVRF